MTIVSKWFFKDNIGKENVFHYILERKNALLGYKKKKLKKKRKIDIFTNGLIHGFCPKKSRIIDIFPKGLTNGFGPKMAIFPNFFFGQNRLGKCFLRYFTPKKLFSTL